MELIPPAAIEASSRQAVRRWLEHAAFAACRDDLVRLITAQDWHELNDSFYKMIPFGTGGRRGKMGVGPNRLNFRTVGESAQGLACYLLKQAAEMKDQPLHRRVVIGYDTRRQARAFARECACILAAHGFTALLFDGHRATPEISFAVRYLKADAGIVISASHNPPSDNGFKAYWRDGAQVLPPHDQGIIAEVERVETIERLDFEEACERGLVRMLGAGACRGSEAEVDRAYAAAVVATALGTQRRVRLVYSPLHGAGTTNVSPVLRLAGFTDLHLVESQSNPDGDFSNVANHIPNPEAPAALTEAIAVARRMGADLAMASDPDADRLGVAAPMPDGSWRHLSGNQLGAMLTHYILHALRRTGKLPHNGLLMTTLVTTDLATRIANDFGVRIVNDLLVGFKHMAELIGKLDDPDRFLFAFEESHGYLRGATVRDKDAAVAALLVAELAAELKREGRSLAGYLDDLYRAYGYFYEQTRSLFLEGSAGSRKMDRVMRALRRQPPAMIGGAELTALIDRQTGLISNPRTGADIGTVQGTCGNVLVYQLSPDGSSRIVIRPSGTEPKLKIYGFGYAPVPSDINDEMFARLQAEVQTRTSALLDGFEQLTQRLLDVDD